MLHYFGMIVFLLSQLLTIRVFHDQNNSSFGGLITGLLFWELILFGMTEILSVFRMISFPGILLAWIIYDALLTAYCVFLKKRGKPAGVRLRFRLENKTETFLAAVIIVIAAVQFVFACFTVPYNYDSMTYHLPRIMMWVQHHSVDYYATDIIRQNVSPVLAEYNNLHWMLLCGGDQFANLVQYKAFVFNGIILWEVLREMGCIRVWRLISTVIYMTANIVLAESISTQTDLFAACWLMATLYYVVLLSKKEHLGNNKADCFQMFMLAVSVALTYLSKPNLCISSVLLILWVLARRIRCRDSLLTLGKYVVFCGITILVMVLPTWLRNVEFAGDIMASDYMGMIATGTWNPKYILLNVYKNFGCLSVLPYTGSKWILLGRKLASLLGADLNAEVISFGGIEYTVYYSNNMDLAGAPGIILLTIIVTIVYLLCFLPHEKNRSENRYGSLILCLLLSVLMTMSVTRWQPWGSRLMLHSCILSAAACGYLLNEMDSRKNVRTGLYVIPWILFAVFTAVNVMLSWNYHGAIAAEGAGSHGAARQEQYFRENPGEKAFYASIISELEKSGHEIEKVGFFTNSSVFEYPLMLYLSENGTGFEAVHLTSDPAGECMNCTYDPEYVISMKSGISPEKSFYCNGHTYELIKTVDDPGSMFLVYHVK